MQKINLKAIKRSGAGKGDARQLRRNGKIPAILYGESEKEEPIYVGRAEFETIIRNHKGERFLINLGISSEEGDQATEYLTIIQSAQRDPLKDDYLHLDFLRISLDKPIHTEIPIHLTGVAAGVRLGGVLDFIHRSLEISCLPMDIPDYIEADIAGLEIGHTLHVSDLVVSEKIKVLTDTEQTVAIVAAPTVQKREEETAEGGGGAAGAEGEKAEDKAKEPEAEKKD